MHVQAFQDKDNELISFIKNANVSCTVYLGKILPRGDVDVTEFNRSIQRVEENWAKNHVQYIDDTHNLFVWRNGLPWKHYNTNDGVHLSNSGVKTLLDAIYRHVHIAKDFQSCVYKKLWNVQYGSTTFENQQEILHMVIECNLLTSVIVLVSAMEVRWQDILLRRAGTPILNRDQAQ